MAENFGFLAVSAATMLRWLTGSCERAGPTHWSSSAAVRFIASSGVANASQTSLLPSRRLQSLRFSSGLWPSLALAFSSAWPAPFISLSTATSQLADQVNASNLKIP